MVRWQFGNSKKTENPSRGLRPTSHKIQHCLSLKWLKVKVHIHKNKRIRLQKIIHCLNNSVTSEKCIIVAELISGALYQLDFFFCRSLYNSNYFHYQIMRQFFNMGMKNNIQIIIASLTIN